MPLLGSPIASHPRKMEQNPDEIIAKFEELSVLESEFDDVELEIIRKAEALHAPLYKKRAEFTAQIPHFWALVFEQAPPEIDTFLQPSDSKVLADCLDTFEVERFEIDTPKGSPRSFSLKFGFKENEYFEDKALEKKFWYRMSDDWAGLVSEPVKIHWKEGKDLTLGLTDAAFKFDQARKKLAGDSSKIEDRKKEAKTKEWKELAQKINTDTEASVSFFALFAFVSGFRFVSAEESEKVTKEIKERLEKIKNGEKVEDKEDEEEDEDTIDYQEVEIFPNGDELATIIAEDMWPNAIKYYKTTFEEEADDEDLSDLSDVEMDDEEEDESDAEVDIRALVGKGRKSGESPPAKKQRKA